MIVPEGLDVTRRTTAAPARRRPARPGRDAQRGPVPRTPRRQAGAGRRRRARSPCTSSAGPTTPIDGPARPTSSRRSRPSSGATRRRAPDRPPRLLDGRRGGLAPRPAPPSALVVGRGRRGVHRDEELREAQRRPPDVPGEGPAHLRRRRLRPQRLQRADGRLRRRERPAAAGVDQHRRGAEIARLHDEDRGARHPRRGHRLPPRRRRQDGAQGRPGQRADPARRSTTSTPQGARPEPEADQVRDLHAEVQPGGLAGGRAAPGALPAGRTVDAEIQGETVVVREAENVAVLGVDRHAGETIRLGGQEFPLESGRQGARCPTSTSAWSADGWEQLDYDDSRAFEENAEHGKRHNLQGPIDDAFTGPFLCVRGTGTPWSPQVQDAGPTPRLETVRRRLARSTCAASSGSRRTPSVTPDDIERPPPRPVRRPRLEPPAGAGVLKDLPLTWTRTSSTPGRPSYPPADHVPVLIALNPLEPAPLRRGQQRPHLRRAASSPAPTPCCFPTSATTPSSRPTAANDS